MPKKSGFALAVILIALVVLLIAGLGLLTLCRHTMLFAIRNVSEITARAAADAGLEKALLELNKKLKAKAIDDGTLPHAALENLPNSQESFSYTVTKDTINNCYVVESIGKSGSVEKKVKASLQLQGPFDYALFTKNYMELKNGTVVDCPDCGATGNILQVGTNSTKAASVMMKAGVTVKGDVAVGVGGDPNIVITTKSEATITGRTYALAEQNVLTPVTVPSALALLPTEPGINNNTTITASGKYDSIHLGNGEIIKIDGPVALYITNDVVLDNSAQLQIVDAATNPNASLTLYLGGNLTCKNGSIINNLTKDPKKLKIFGLDSCKWLTFMTASDFYGAVYTPAAGVRMNNSVEVFGSIVADSFIQAVAAGYHYDASLKKVNQTDDLVRFVIQKWFEG